MIKSESGETAVCPLEVCIPEDVASTMFEISGYTALFLLYPLSVLHCSSVLVIFFVLKSF